MFKIAYKEIYNHPLPTGHRFPMAKYDLLPKQLLHEGTIEAEQLFEPKPMPEDLISSVHSKAYIESLKNGTINKKELRRIGFPYSRELLIREIAIAQGTAQAALSALSDGIAFNIAGGTHHAFTGRGEGFCIFNDMAVGAKHLISGKRVKRVLIVDLDVHQGNGTASIFAKDESVFTFSMHGANNFPFHKEISNLDVELEDGTEGDLYLELLKKHLYDCVEKHKPDFIFYQAGVDVLESDKLGKLKLSIEDCLERDLMLFEKAITEGIPLTVVMGGGYSEKISRIIEAHSNSYRIAKRLFG